MKPLGHYLNGDPTAVYLLEAELKAMTTDQKLQLVTWLTEAVREETHRDWLRKTFAQPEATS